MDLHLYKYLFYMYHLMNFDLYSFINFGYIKEDIKDLHERNENLTLGKTAYKHQNQELFTQKEELYRKIIFLSQKLNYKGKEHELNK